jgi:hypothetical protein
MYMPESKICITYKMTLEFSDNHFTCGMVQIKLITKETPLVSHQHFHFTFSMPHEKLPLQKVSHLKNNLTMLQSKKLHDHDSKNISQNYIT